MLSTAATVLAASIGARAGDAPAQGSQAPQSPAQAQAGASEEDEEKFAAVGEQTTEKICIICHPWENITQRRRTVPEWGDVIVNMAQRGAPGTEQQFAIVKKFVARYYGLVNVNTATADELSMVLGLSAKDAKAIVEYRKTNGKFAGIAALAKVEGIDRKKLEEQPDALMFE